VTDAEDSLERYRTKRDPGVTNEPFGVPLQTKGETLRGSFVIHLHDATRRHYDLRIQVGGALASFAIPRGPSLDPEEKRLAVQTENHPFEYLDFEDTIPEGNYGAGPMIVWDIGTVQYLEAPVERGIAAGKVDFLLFGHKVRGRFALVETTARVKPKPKQRQWLLLKKADAFATPKGPDIVLSQPESVLSGLTVEELGTKAERYATLLTDTQAAGARDGAGLELKKLTPMLCANEGASLTDPARFYELKLDGVRIVAERRGSEVRLKYRKPRFCTESYPEIARALKSLFPTDFVIDGEIVAFDDKGKPNFQRIAPRIHAQRPFDVTRAMGEVSVVYLVFDLLSLGTFDLRELPLWQRKALLARFIPRRGLVRMLDHLEGNGQALFDLCQKQGLEGVVSKDRHSKYKNGPERTGLWVKHKCEREDDFVVVGWVEGKGSRGLGALELGSYRGDVLVYRGRVGGGFDDATLRGLEKRLAELAAPEPLYTGDPIEDGRPRHAVQPVLVVRVRYLEWTDEGRLRMAVFLGFPQTPPRACRAAPEDERIEALLVTADTPATPLVKPTLQSSSRLQLSNLDKVFWPEEGYTKGDLLTYYERIAPVLLPLLAERPIMLVRYPDGIEGKNFYQWNVPQGTPTWLETLDLRNEERDGKNVTTFLAHDVDSLLHVINLGCIPIHVLAARRQSLDFCDFLTIDFDLGEQPFSEAVRLTLGLKGLLDELGLIGFPKTSGQEGLHVLIPLGPGVPFAAARSLVELLGRLLQLRHPDTSTMQRRVGERSGRAYIDTGQTGRSRTIVSAYSVRAYRGATVSTPLFWEEVHLALKPDAWTMFTVPERIADRGDPYAGLLEARPNVSAALEKLGKMLR
jgi:bifunctional non-homologous end joining protein LigD